MRNTSHIILQKIRSGALIFKRNVSVVEYGRAVERMCLTETAGKPRDGGQCRTRLVNRSRTFQDGYNARQDLCIWRRGGLDGSPMQAMQAMPRSKLGGGVEKIESAWSGYFIICGPLCGNQPPGPNSRIFPGGLDRWTLQLGSGGPIDHPSHLPCVISSLYLPYLEVPCGQPFHARRQTLPSCLPRKS